MVSGHLARLNCRVRNLGNRTVSWIRLQDLSLLTVGRYTYTSDLRFDLLPFSTFFFVPTRFEGIHAKHSPDWQLALKNTRLTDSGALGGSDIFSAVSTQDLTSARSQRAPTWPTWSTSRSEVTPQKQSW